MTNLYDIMVPAPLVELATNGYASLNTQRAWVQRHVFFTPLPEAKAGKPRQFPLIAAYEADLLSWAGRAGLPLSLVKEMFAWAQSSLQPEGGWVGDIVDLARQNKFEEFLPRSGSKAAYWVALIDYIGRNSETPAPSLGDETLPWGPRTASIVAFFRGDAARVGEMVEALASPEYASGILVIPISAHVQNVNRVLTEAGIDLSGLPAVTEA